MQVARKVRRRAFAVGLVALVTGCGNASPTLESSSGRIPGVRTLADSTSAAAGDAEAFSDVPQLSTAGRDAASDLAERDGDDAWAVPDAVLEPLEHLWDDARGAYVSPGGQISTRLNAELLRIHAAATRADHDGTARQDARIERLATYLAGPAFVATSAGETFGQSRHNVVHVPGWRQSSIPPVNQHPSIDATVARGLRAAWAVRDVVELTEPTRNAILRNVVSVATSEAFRAPARLLNQINWNADLYAASATISGDPTPLLNDYREQLRWFARHAHRPVIDGGLPNLSVGNGFHYQPNGGPNPVVNRSDTVEYANTVLGALRYYDDALRAGMEPLPEADRKTLAAWRDRVIRSDWTPSGYLNWETGKGSARLHLRQYWALALDGAVMALRGTSALSGDVGPATGDQMLSRSVLLFRRWTASAETVLLPATSFGFPSQFAGVRGNRVTASVRFAATVADWAADCRCDGRLPTPAVPALHVDVDPGLRRVTVNGARYATAISPVARPTGGGLEPGWILDGQARPIGPLGGGDDGSIGLRLDRGSSPILDTQPGVRDGTGLRLRQDPKDPELVRGEVRGDGARVRVEHRFTATTIETRYRITPGGRASVHLRIPSAGRDGTVECSAAPNGADDSARTDATRPAAATGPASPSQPVAGAAPLPGCGPGQRYRVRSGDAAMQIDLSGLPRGATVRRTRPKARTTLPDPGLQATVSFTTTKPIEIRRVLTPQAD